MTALERILEGFADSGHDVVLVLVTGEKIVGLIESAFDGIVTVTRGSWNGKAPVYADTQRHYALAHIVGAYLEGS